MGTKPGPSADQTESSRRFLVPVPSPWAPVGDGALRPLRQGWGGWGNGEEE